VVKVLVYSSKKIYDTASFVGRAEADIIAYKEDDDYYYRIMKNRTAHHIPEKVIHFGLKYAIERIERAEFYNEMKLVESSAKHV
jgi:Ser-tRNA(Ala) deacylase AlaX